jgi:plastocyanin
MIESAGSLAWSRRRVLLALSLAAIAPSARAAGTEVEIKQFAFTPAEIEVAKGGTVTFVNLDLAPHTATGESFDTGMLRNGERKEIAFPDAGAFSYFCKFHRHMTGRIVVR